MRPAPPSSAATSATPSRTSSVAASASGSSDTSCQRPVSRRIGADTIGRPARRPRHRRPSRAVSRRSRAEASTDRRSRNGSRWRRARGKTARCRGRRRARAAQGRARSRAPRAPVRAPRPPRPRAASGQDRPALPRPARRRHGASAPGRSRPPRPAARRARSRGRAPRCTARRPRLGRRSLPCPPQRGGTASDRRRRRTAPRPEPPPARPTRARPAARRRRPRRRSRASRSCPRSPAGRRDRPPRTGRPRPARGPPRGKPQARRSRRARPRRPGRAWSEAPLARGCDRSRSRRGLRRSSCRRRRSRPPAQRLPRGSKRGPHRSIVSYRCRRRRQQRREGNLKRRLAVGLAVALGVLTAGVGVATSYGAKTATTTLTMWSYDNQDPGLEPVLKQLSKQFEQSHPGVKINLVFKDFNSLVGTVPRALASGSGPDVTEGNQGYQTDAQLVKAKLILPLDKYIKKYHWDRLYSPSTWGMFRWTADGKSFGKGPIWGIAQTGQHVAVYYNRAKLRSIGINPDGIPTTFAAFDKALGQLRAKLPKSDPVIEEGNK